MKKMQLAVSVMFVIVTLCLGTAAVASAASNVLSWTDNATNEAGFTIERALVSSVAACAPTLTTFTFLASVGANITTFTDAGLSENQGYCYRVKATNSGGDSGYSNAAGRFIPLSAANGAPSNLLVVPGP